MAATHLRKPGKRSNVYRCVASSLFFSYGGGAPITDLFPCPILVQYSSSTALGLLCDTNAPNIGALESPGEAMLL